MVGVAAALIAATLGSLIGILAGFYGGRLDMMLMRSIDVLMAFPYILLALAIVAVLGPGLMNALIAVAIVNIPFLRAMSVGLHWPLRSLTSSLPQGYLGEIRSHYYYLSCYPILSQ